MCDRARPREQNPAWRCRQLGSMRKSQPAWQQTPAGQEKSLAVPDEIRGKAAFGNVRAQIGSWQFAPNSSLWGIGNYAPQFRSFPRLQPPPDNGRQNLFRILAWNSLDASATLIRYCEALELPEIILERLAILSDKLVKLMCWVGEADPTTDPRTVRMQPGLYASDLFVKLFKAVRALDWELVLVLIEHAQTPLHKRQNATVDQANPSAVTYQGATEDNYADCR